MFEWHSSVVSEHKLKDRYTYLSQRKHSNIQVANRPLRFLLELQRLEKKLKSLNAKKLEERVTDILNEYIIRGSERMLDLTDPERREVSNLVRSSPDITNFDRAREKVVRVLDLFY